MLQLSLKKISSRLRVGAHTYYGCSQHGRPLVSFGKSQAGFLSSGEAMTSAYGKPYVPVSDQVALLMARGLTCDEVACTDALESIGYYRLSGYWYPYRVVNQLTGKPLSQLTPGTTLDQVLALYRLDQQLKMLVLRGLELIEIEVRARTGHVLGAHGAFAHLDPARLDVRFTSIKRGQTESEYDIWLRRARESQARSSDDFVTHYRATYGGDLPIWMLTEVLDLGGIAWLYGGLRAVDRNSVAAGLGVMHPDGSGYGDALKNWLRALNYVRNICAHHSRLWNRNMTVQLKAGLLNQHSYMKNTLIPAGLPRTPAGMTQTPRTLTRVFGALSVIVLLLKNMADPAVGQRWQDELTDLLTTYVPQAGRNLSEMGFPLGWQTLPVWR